MSKMLQIVAELKHWWEDPDSGDFIGRYKAYTVTSHTHKYPDGKEVRVKPVYRADQGDYWVIKDNDTMYVLFKDAQRKLV